MKYLLLAVFGVCWATSVKDKDIFKPISDEMIEYINKYSGAKWKVKFVLIGLQHDKINKMTWGPSKGSDHPRHPRLIKSLLSTWKTWVLGYPNSAQRRLWSDWADAQTDLSLHWPHRSVILLILTCGGSYFIENGLSRTKVSIAPQKAKACYIIAL